MKLFKFFILRTPLLPHPFEVRDVFQLFKDCETLQEVIHVSSKTLFKKIVSVLNGETTDENSIHRIEHSLLKYIKRASYRPVPYGLSAGVSIGEIQDKTDIMLVERNKYIKSVRLDMSLLCAIYRKLIERDDITHTLIWYPNNTLYRVDGEYRYYEYQHIGDRQYSLSSFKATDVVTQIIELSKNGIQLGALLTSLESLEYDRGESQSYLRELIDSKVLISELEPSVSGVFYSRRILSFLEKNSHLKEDALTHIRDVLERSERLTCTIDKCNIGEYEKLAKVLNDSNVEFDALVQVDLYKPLLHKSLDEKIALDLKEAIEISNNLNNHIPYSARMRLDNFISEFGKRYEGMEIPLLIALDSDLGIGYPAGLDIEMEDDLVLPIHSSETAIIYDYRQNFYTVLEKYHNCISEKSHEIELTTQDYNSIVRKKNYGAEIIVSMVSLVREESGLKIVHLGSEPVGAGMSARFGHLNPELFQANKAICIAEEEYYRKLNAIVVEVVFLPSDKGGNIVARPELRKFEVPIIANSSVTAENVVPLDDIMMSVSQNKIVLRSKSRSVFIIPKFSSAFNSSLCKHPIFNFFSDLKYQSLEGYLNWSWGVLSDMPFLPRVRYKNIVITRAKWTVNYHDVETLIRHGDSSGLIEHFNKKNIPLKFCLSQNDDFLLPLNLNLSSDFEMFTTELKKHKRVTLMEDIFANGTDMVVKGPEGHFTNELMVFWNNLESQTVFSPTSNKFNYMSKKTFIPGEDWIFTTIYCGKRVADRIIKDHFVNMVGDLKRQFKTLTWFFIRYSDPKFHLRLRIRSTPSSNEQIRHVLADLFKRLYDAKLIWDVKNEVYNRELQRYGDLNIENAESFFCIDSECVSDILVSYPEIELAPLRWKIALAGVHFLLEDFNLTLDQKIDFTEKAKQYLFNEHGSNKESIKWLKNKYREKRVEIEKVVRLEHYELEAAYKAFQKRSFHLQPIINQMYKMYETGTLKIMIEDIAPSFIHMFLNRMLINKSRLQETTIYDLLNVYYCSVKTRNKILSDKGSPNMSL